MAFGDLNEFFDDQLHLPIGGVTYDIPSPDYELGLWVTAMVSAGIDLQNGLTGTKEGTAKLPQLRFEGDEYDDDSQESKLYQRLLGDAWPKLRADGVSWPKIKHVAMTAIVWIAIGAEQAEAIWNAGDDPKAVAAATAGNANRAMRRHATASTRTGTANTTGRRGSTKATTSRSTKPGRSTPPS